MRRSLEDQRCAFELSDHPIDVPEAVAKHDPVVRLAEPSDVSVGIAQQTGDVDQAAPTGAGPLLRVLTPLAGAVDTFTHPEARGRHRRLHVGRPDASSLAIAEIAGPELVSFLLGHPRSGEELE